VHSELTQSEFFRSVGCRSYNTISNGGHSHVE
jgi:hypothetical protein